MKAIHGVLGGFLLLVTVALVYWHLSGDSLKQGIILGDLPVAGIEAMPQTGPKADLSATSQRAKVPSDTPSANTLNDGSPADGVRFDLPKILAPLAQRTFVNRSFAEACLETLPEIGRLRKNAPSDQWRAAVEFEVMCLDALQRAEESFALLQEILRRFPTDIVALRKVSEQFIQKKEYAKAIELLQKSLAIKREGYTLERLSRAQDRRADELLRVDYWAHVTEAERLRAEAIAHLREAVDLMPPEQQAFMRMELAKRLAVGGQSLDEAVRVGQQALTEALARVGSEGLSLSTVAHMHVEFGRLMYEQGQREVGISYMDQGIALTPDPEFRRVLERNKQIVLGQVTPQDGDSYTIPND